MVQIGFIVNQHFSRVSKTCPLTHPMFLSFFGPTEQVGQGDDVTWQ